MVLWKLKRIRSVSTTVPKRAGAPFVKSNGNAELEGIGREFQRHPYVKVECLGWIGPWIWNNGVRHRLCRAFVRYKKEVRICHTYVVLSFYP